ncbi:MAG TPA: hypothetical protein VLT47_09960 [Anaeromyxobacteraceae bacterium]|nr:hypothetical protein [Anaeromyxobacteraceae bacterium]
MVLLNALVALFTLLMLFRHAPRAVLFVAPRSVRITGDAAATPRASGQIATGELLAQLGFQRLGLRRERGPIGGLDLEVDAWAHPDGTCADAYPAGSRQVVVSFLTSLADGFLVGTSNFRRTSVEGTGGRVGGIPGAGLEGALAAHRKAVGPLAAAHGTAQPVADLAGRIGLAHRFYAGIGAAELRRPSFMSLLNTALAVVLLGTAVKGILRGLGVLG